MRLLLLEVLFLALVVAGVAVIYWPAGLIAAGVLGVLACEAKPPAEGEQVTR